MKILILFGLLVIVTILFVSCRDRIEDNSNITGIATPPNPSPTQLIRTSIVEKGQKEWEITKASLFDTKYPLTSEASIDVDGDGKKDKVIYSIKPWEDDFEGFLKIISARGNTLWEHSFYMSKNDMGKFLVEVLEYDSINEWVKSVFIAKKPYSFEAEKIKLEKKEINNEQLNYAAKVGKFSADAIRKEILSISVNRIFSYRAEWREDLMLIVYVPSLRKFICYSRGY